MKKVLVAPDSFKGSLSSEQVAECVAEALQGCGHNVMTLAVSDGGEGFCRIVTSALGGSFRDCRVHDPLGRPIKASYGVAEADAALFGEEGGMVKCAVIDVASASGLTLLQSGELDPWNATTFGTGELIRHAVRQGRSHILLGLGGSATVDCGFGMLAALAEEGLQHDVHVLAAADVKAPLCGLQGAALCFARQKGAGEELIAQLEERNRRRGRLLEQRCGHSVMEESGAAAAGGLGAAVLSLPHGRVVPGTELVLDILHFDDLLADCCLVVTGEGKADSQTLLGKAPFVIARKAQQQNVPCILLAGRVMLTKEEINLSPWCKVICVTPDTMREEALAPSVARRNIKESVQRDFSCLLSQ